MAAIRCQSRPRAAPTNRLSGYTRRHKATVGYGESRGHKGVPTYLAGDDMIKRLLILLAGLILVYNISLASDTKKQFDLYISVPDEFSYVSLNPVSPIDYYTEGYSKGFREALEKHLGKEEMIPEKVSGHGEFISGHYNGFKNGASQLLKLKQELTD